MKSGFEATHRKLQAELDKTVFGHQLFVQAEFEAMKAVFPLVERVRSAFYDVRAAYFNATPPSIALMTPEERTQRYEAKRKALIVHWRIYAFHWTGTLRSSSREFMRP